jgi:antitoxin (DNA-binding transcriptional repressor) of toxin-antitoxin stability system
MIQITYQELENQFDEIFSRVENGESFIINYDGKQIAMIPYANYEKSMDELTSLYSQHNNEAP